MFIENNDHEMKNRGNSNILITENVLISIVEDKKRPHDTRLGEKESV